MKKRGVLILLAGLLLLSVIGSAIAASDATSLVRCKKTITAAEFQASAAYKSQYETNVFSSIRSHDIFSLRDNEQCQINGQNSEKYALDASLGYFFKNTEDCKCAECGSLIKLILCEDSSVHNKATSRLISVGPNDADPPCGGVEYKSSTSKRTEIGYVYKTPPSCITTVPLYSCFKFIQAPNTAAEDEQGLWIQKPSLNNCPADYPQSALIGYVPAQKICQNSEFEVSTCIDNAYTSKMTPPINWPPANPAIGLTKEQLQSRIVDAEAMIQSLICKNKCLRATVGDTYVSVNCNKVEKLPQTALQAAFRSAAKPAAASTAFRAVTAKVVALFKGS